jgi:hypothetical protein
MALHPDFNRDSELKTYFDSPPEKLQMSSAVPYTPSGPAEIRIYVSALYGQRCAPIFGFWI